MAYLVYFLTGGVMGVFGGLLGIGGSVVMIPALVFFYGINQHLYQAAAMICNFFVGASASVSHIKKDLIDFDVLKFLIPSALVGIICGVAISNTAIFAGRNDILLARVFGVFMIYVIIYNLYRLYLNLSGKGSFKTAGIRFSPALIVLCGLLTGVPAGLLGIGGGVVCIPTQQLFLKMPLKKAIANSAATIAAIALAGALYKNLTLPEHNIKIIQSLKIVIGVFPGAVVGAFIGSRLMHILPKNIVRLAFIMLNVVACFKMLTAGQAS